MCFIMFYINITLHIEHFIYHIFKYFKMRAHLLILAYFSFKPFCLNIFFIFIYDYKYRSLIRFADSNVFLLFQVCFTEIIGFNHNINNYVLYKEKLFFRITLLGFPQKKINNRNENRFM